MSPTLYQNPLPISLSPSSISFPIFLSPFSHFPQSSSHLSIPFLSKPIDFFFLLTSSPFFLNICIFFFLSMLSQFYQGKGISKSVSMNCGPCQGMALSLKALSHSDSYTWAMENRRPSNARSLNREGSVSSLGSQEVSFSDICSENCTHTESQV